MCSYKRLRRCTSRAIYIYRKYTNAILYMSVQVSLVEQCYIYREYMHVMLSISV